jgi:FAD/FMN-containing dehydrogenase
MVGCDRVDEIIEFVYWLQRLKLGDECLVLDRLNLSAILEKEPKAIEEMSSTLPHYILICVVAGYDRFPEERLDYQTKDIMEIAQRYGLNLAKTLPGVNSRKLLQALGEPCPEPFWKLRYKGSSADIFFLTTLDRSPEYINVMHEKACETGFPIADIGMYIQPIQQGRSCHMEFNLTFNPGNKSEVARVQRTFEQASKALMLKGAFFSRPYGTWAELIHNQCVENVIALRKVKQIFDPNNVMNPGKLFF